MALPRSIKTFSLLASSIAGIIGSGWLLGPFVSAKYAGPAAIICWLIAGVLMIIVSGTFVILTRKLPIVGGTVRFFQLSYGHFAGFSFSWIAWLAWVAVSPIETLALLQYSANYIPGLMTSGPHPSLTLLGVFIAAFLVALISLINSYRISFYSAVNYVILGFKLFIPVLTVALLFSHHFNTANFTAAGGFMPYGIQSIFSALPVAGVIYSLIGFNPAIQMAGETKNPRLAIPFAIFGSLLICTILYALIQTAFISSLPTASISNGWSHLSFIGDNGPFAGLLAGIGFLLFAKLLYVDAAISPFGTAMVQAMATGRMTYAMSKNRYLPKYLLSTNRHNAPARAIWLNMVIGLLFILPFPSWQRMVGFLVSCLVLGYVVGPMSLMIFTAKQPKQNHKIPRWMIQVYCLIAFYVCNLIIYWTGWDIIFKVLIAFGIGYIVLGCKVAWNKFRKKELYNLSVASGSWVVLYMIGMGIISYLSSFHGRNIIPFGTDFIVMAFFTMTIYGFAWLTAARVSNPIADIDLVQQDGV